MKLKYKIGNILHFYHSTIYPFSRWEETRSLGISWQIPPPTKDSRAHITPLDQTKPRQKKKLLGRLNNTSEKDLFYSCLTLVLVDVTWLVGVRVMHVGECKGEIGCAAHCHALQALRTHKGFMHCMYWVCWKVCGLMIVCVIHCVSRVGWPRVGWPMHNDAGSSWVRGRTGHPVGLRKWRGEKKMIRRLRLFNILLEPLGG